MNKILKFCILLLGAALISSCGNSAVEAASSLTSRIAPQYSGKITFRQIPGGADSYEFFTRGGQLIIKGGNSNAMAVGLNRYLKEYCLAEVSWMADEPVTLPEAMPSVEGRVCGKALVKDRFFLNYCTYGYTMPYWKWNEWERLIDWMALNGVNMAFATTGQESVWYEVWKELGLSDGQILDYFTGPAHLPWHRLDNVDHFQGNPPESWMEGQVELQKKIVSRERELGIVPVFQVFSGHAPEALKELFPDAKIHPLSQNGSNWGGMPAEEYGAWFLEATDPLFARIQKAYIEKSTELFGTDHVYGADPFNEVQSPDWSPEFLASVARGIYDTMREADPQARWLQMTWLFYNDSAHWTPENIKAYLTAVPQGGLTLLDYFCDCKELWKDTENFHAQPYIWCLLENFGGNTALIGNFQKIKADIDNVLANGGASFSGLGATMEALDCNQWLFEYLFEKAWTPSGKDPVDAVADRTLGREDEEWRALWHRMVNSIYAFSPAGGRQGTVLSTRPTNITNTRAGYNNVEAVEIWRSMLSVEPSGSDAYRFWLVNMGRQALGNQFDDLYADFKDALLAGDVKRMKELRTSLLSLATDLELLLSQHPYFSFGKWCDMARAWGADESEADYYEKNARTLLTTWGTRDIDLLDYANHAWAGLVGSFHAVRWQMYLDAAVAEAEAGRRLVPGTKAFVELKEKLADFEIGFALSTQPFARTAAGDVREICSEICERQFGNYAKRVDRFSRLFREYANTSRYESIIGGVTFRPKAIFIGDSITEGWSIHPDFFISRGCLFLGISGQTSSQILQRFRTDVLPLRPEKVFILCGTNDIAGNDAPYNKELTLGNIATMCRMAKAAGIEPLLCSVTPSDYFFWNPALGDPSATIKDLNASIRAYAGANGFRYVDYHSALDNGHGVLKEEYSKDRCHLSEEGYFAMEKVALKAL